MDGLPLTEFKSFVKYSWLHTMKIFSLLSLMKAIINHLDYIIGADELRNPRFDYYKDVSFYIDLLHQFSSAKTDNF